MLTNESIVHKYFCALKKLAGTADVRPRLAPQPIVIELFSNMHARVLYHTIARKCDLRSIISSKETYCKTLQILKIFRLRRDIVYKVAVYKVLRNRLHLVGNACRSQTQVCAP